MVELKAWGPEPLPTAEELAGVSEDDAYVAMANAWIDDAMEGTAPLPNVLICRVLRVLLERAFPATPPADKLREIVGARMHPAIVSGRDLSRVVPTRPPPTRP
jgi:hypothetical protein